MEITMGNDEFILFLRKNGQTTKSTDELGREIWIWMKANIRSANKVKEDETCYWGNVGDSVAPNKLPKTATQFSFDSSELPQLYEYLKSLCP